MSIDQTVDTRSFLHHTHEELHEFLRRLGEDEARSKQNYFRWLEYPLALSLAEPANGQRILEIGAGYLNVLPLYLASKFGAEVHAVDKEKLPPDAASHIDALRRRCDVPDDALTVRQADASALPYDNERFDRVLCVSTLEHTRMGEDSRIVKEIGRVLKMGGRAVLTFPFNHGEHIETEAWHGEEYAQRHYNEYTARWRVVWPSNLHFVSATVFGEIDPDTGKRYLAMPLDEREKFCRDNAARWDQFWRVYYHVEHEEFYINASEIPNDVAQSAGLIALVLEKRETAPNRTYFTFDPFEFYVQNEQVTKTLETAAGVVSIDRVLITNDRDDELDVFEPGQSLLIHAHFTCKGRVKNPIFIIAFHDTAGNVVFGLNTRNVSYHLGMLDAGEHKMLVRFGLLNLLQGKYTVSVGAWEYDSPDPIPPYPYDMHYRRYTLVVREKLQGLSGTVYMPYSVEID